jgi:glycosyltransferase involved in cell wall biosynthesis
MSHRGQTIGVIIPVLNEERALPLVLAELPAWVDEILVVDNGSTDRSTEVAHQAGALVISEPRRGYGRACLAGIAALGPCDIIVFLDGDHSDYPEDLPLLVDPIVHGQADFVLGSRLLGSRERGAMPPQSVWGNRLACLLMRLLFGVRYTDLGPFRAITRQTLEQLGMGDLNYGWTVEMQIKAARRRLRITEVPVRYRQRIGRSKISGTLRGTILAGYKILATILSYGILEPLAASRQDTTVSAPSPRSHERSAP